MKRLDLDEADPSSILAANQHIVVRKAVWQRGVGDAAFCEFCANKEDTSMPAERFDPLRSPHLITSERAFLYLEQPRTLRHFCTILGAGNDSFSDGDHGSKIRRIRR